MNYNCKNKLREDKILIDTSLSVIVRTMSTMELKGIL